MAPPPANRQLSCPQKVAAATDTAHNRRCREKSLQKTAWDRLPWNFGCTQKGVIWRPSVSSDFIPNYPFRFHNFQTLNPETPSPPCQTGIDGTLGSLTWWPLAIVAGVASPRVRVSLTRRTSGAFRETQIPIPSTPALSIRPNVNNPLHLCTRKILRGPKVCVSRAPAARLPANSIPRMLFSALSSPLCLCRELRCRAPSPAAQAKMELSLPRRT
jgi:hypothetical protein